MGQKKDKKDQKDQDKTTQAEVESLQEQLDAVQSEKDELFDKLQRVSADYANYQKRVPKQISDSVGYEKERIIKGLLPVLDNFEHTLQNAAKVENAEPIVKGVQIVYDQMQDFLKSQGVEQIAAKGQPFDPMLHEAMLQQSDPEKDDRIVLEEYQKGYRLNDRTLRPSKVVVNKLESAQPVEDEPADDQQDTDAETVDTETQE